MSVQVKFEKGDQVLDNNTKQTERVVDKTTNSYCITQTKTGKEGINCTQWFSDDKWFQLRFTLII